MQRPQKAEEILDVAERMARTGGYQGFSFRDIATAVGVKSASVHYHFPTKEDLGTALAERYTKRFLEALGHPEEYQSPQSALKAYINAYRTALVEDGLMCLCGMMGSEIAALPEPVARETRAFFEKNITWLETALDRDNARQRALRIIAALEGGMILARTLNDPDILDQVMEDL